MPKTSHDELYKFTPQQQHKHRSSRNASPPTMAEVTTVTAFATAI